jgi:PAS domain S-box-containing protein
MDVATQKITYMSGACYELTGFTIDEYLNMTIKDILPEQSLQLANEMMQKEIDKVLNINEESEGEVFEIQQYHKDGSLMWVEISAKLLPFVATDSKIEMIATTRLIDKRKKNEAKILEQTLALEQQQKDLIRQKLNLEEHTMMLEQYNMQIAGYSKELEKQKKELEQANVTKDRFFSIIAHDLRNAMNSLTNIASIFEDYYATMTPAQVTKNIESFVKSTSNTGKLLENLLN